MIDREWMHECMNAWMHANNHLDIHLTQTTILPTQKKCKMFKRNLSNLPQTICMKCNIPPKKRVRILMTLKMAPVWSKPLHSSAPLAEVVQGSVGLPSAGKTTMITWSHGDFFPRTQNSVNQPGPNKNGDWFFWRTKRTKRVLKKKKHLLAGIHRRFSLGGGFYTEKEMWHKRMFLLKSFTSPYIHKPHIKGEEWFSDSGLPPNFSQFFVWLPPTANCYRASNFWFAQPPFRAHHVSQLNCHDSWIS